MSEYLTFSPGMTLDDVEKWWIMRAYDYFQKNKTATAIALGVSVRTLDNKFERYDEEEVKHAAVLAQRKANQEDFIRRSRGVTPSIQEPFKQPETHVEASKARTLVEPAEDAPAQPPLSMPQRSQVQGVLPAHASAGGARRAR